VGYVDDNGGRAVVGKGVLVHSSMLSGGDFNIDPANERRLVVANLARV